MDGLPPIATIKPAKVSMAQLLLLNAAQNPMETDLSNSEVFPLPVSKTSEYQEFEILKKQLTAALERIQCYNSSMKVMNDQICQLADKNAVLEKELATKEIEHIKQKEEFEKEIAFEKQKNLTSENALESKNVLVETLRAELQDATKEKITSEAEKLEKIELLMSEKQNLTEENTTLKMLNTEMTQEIASLELINSELRATPRPEPEVVLENELEDTTCSICLGEMRLRKCTPCKRRYHKNCIEDWLKQNNTCPACRAQMHM